MCCRDKIMGLNDADFSLRSCDLMWGVYKGDVFWKSLAPTVWLGFIVLPGFTPPGAARLVSPGSYSLLDGKRQLDLFHWQYNIVSGSPVRCDTSDPAWVPPWKEKTVSTPLSASTTALQQCLLPIPNAQHHPAFRGVSIMSCCVILPRLLLFRHWYKSRPFPPESVRGYRCHTHWSGLLCSSFTHLRLSTVLFCFLSMREKWKSILPCDHLKVPMQRCSSVPFDAKHAPLYHCNESWALF